MAEINYGESDAQRANKAAEAFATSSAASVDALAASFKQKSDELAAGIVSGMRQQDRDVLEKQIADLGNRYSQALAANEGQFAFAEQQAKTTSAAMADEYAQMQDAQRALAAQTLGAASVQLQPGRQTAAQRDAIRQAQQIGAANLAYLGGAGAVPEQLLAPEQRQAIGVTGVAGLARDLYSQSLQAQRAATLAQLQGSQVNLRTALETRALQAAAEREQKERDRLAEFEMTGFNAVLAAKAASDAKLAEFLAVAASADTRSGKEKALADYENFKKQENLKLQNDLKRIGAQARATGATQTSQAVLDMEAEIKGSQSGFGTIFDKILAQRPQGRPTTIKIQDPKNKNKTIDISFDEAIARGLLPAGYSVNGVKGAIYLSGNSLMWEQNPGDPASDKLIPLARLNTILKTAAGYMQANKLSGAKATAYLNQYVIPSLVADDIIALRYLFGTDNPGVLAAILASDRQPTIAPAAPPAVKPQLSIGKGGSLTSSQSRTPSTSPTPAPGASPKPTTKK